MSIDLQPRAAGTRPTYVIDSGRIGSHHLALCLDRDSREVVGLQVAHDAADSVAMALTNAVIAYGIPEVVIVDNGPDYLPMARLCRRLGIGIEHVTPYNATAKGLVERAFRDVRDHLDGMSEVCQ